MARWWRTIAETAVAIGEELERGDDDAALRTLLDGVNQLPGAAAVGELTEALAEPPSSRPRPATRARTHAQA